jgi:hypothetical protein
MFRRRDYVVLMVHVRVMTGCVAVTVPFLALVVAKLLAMDMEIETLQSNFACHTSKKILRPCFLF